MSETQLNDEINKWNKTEYSFLQKLYYSLIGKNFSLKKIECDVEIEFYGINDKMNINCSKLEENAIKETYLKYYYNTDSHPEKKTFIFMNVSTLIIIKLKIRN
jgi:hypothetical protein